MGERARRYIPGGRHAFTVNFQVPQSGDAHAAACRMAASAMEPTKLKPALELALPAVLPSQESLESNERAVLALYDETAVRLLRYARSFGLNDETADVVQDAFVALFRHLCLGRPRHSLTGWLFRVTRNLSLKQRQRERGAPPNTVTDLLLERLRRSGRHARGAPGLQRALPAAAVRGRRARAARSPVRVSAIGRAVLSRHRRRPEPVARRGREIARARPGAPRNRSRR